MLVRDVAGTLHALGDRDTVVAAIHRLGTGPTPERCRAARVLERFEDPRARSALCAALRDRDASVRAGALDALARLGLDLGAARAAAPLVSDPHEQVRRRAVRALGRLSRRPDELVRPALRDPAPAVRREAALLATRLEPVEVAALLADRDPQVRAAAAASAGHDSQAAVASALTSDPHPAVRLAAAQALGAFGGRDAEATLVAAVLDDREAIVRARALRLALEACSRPRVVESLRAELSSERARRREMALRALARLSEKLPASVAARITADRDPMVRLALAQVSSAILDDPDGVLRALSIDDDATVRHAASTHRRGAMR
jgi:HEAT repeat protein